MSQYSNKTEYIKQLIGKYITNEELGCNTPQLIELNDEIEATITMTTPHDIEEISGPPNTSQ
jgi:hypothetical protein